MAATRVTRPKTTSQTLLVLIRMWYFRPRQRLRGRVSVGDNLSRNFSGPLVSWRRGMRRGLREPDQIHQECQGGQGHVSRFKSLATMSVPAGDEKAALLAALSFPVHTTRDKARDPRA